jgi:hypothetical protein
MTTSYCQACTDDRPDLAHSEECKKASRWLTDDLPAMRAIVRAENPGMSKAEVAIEAIRRLG